MEPSNGREEAFRNELFRLNCVEIASESVDDEYADYPIRLVDDILTDDEEEEYVDYVCFGRGGMPNWKAYYDIKNLVETLEDIGSLENKGVKGILDKVEESFLMILFNRVGVDKSHISNPFAQEVFNILRKLEFFYSRQELLLNFILRVDTGSIGEGESLEAFKEYNFILEDENYFLVEEKVLIEILLYYFIPGKEKLLGKSLRRLVSDEDGTILLDFLGNVSVGTG